MSGADTAKGLRTERDRAICALICRSDGIRAREIAAALHMPLATAGSRLRRAKQCLRRDLEGWYFDEH